jgi:DNA-binding FrmR family transcriptional regulator
MILKPINRMKHEKLKPKINRISRVREKLKEINKKIDKIKQILNCLTQIRKANERKEILLLLKQIRDIINNNDNKTEETYEKVIKILDEAINDFEKLITKKRCDDD